MNLPIFDDLQANKCTFITFNKAILDFDKAIAEGKKWHFSRCVALDLPVWANTTETISIFADLSSIGISSTTSPNIVLPKVLQYYLENICRHNISVGLSTNIEEICELAFWKTMNYLTLTADEYKNLITFSNKVMISNFTTVDNNNGWSTVIQQVPNNCNILMPKYRTVENIADIVPGLYTDTCLYDLNQSSNQFNFVGFKDVLDFDNFQYNNVDVSEFKFNVMLIFYIDDYGIDKLYGINFISPFVNKVSYWDMSEFKQQTNTITSRGYQFMLNLKTVNNSTSRDAIYVWQDDTYFNIFEKTLSTMNDFLIKQTGKPNNLF